MWRKKLDELVKAQKAFVDQYTTTDADGKKNFGAGMNESQVIEFQARQKEIEELGPKAELETQMENASKAALGQTAATEGDDALSEAAKAKAKKLQERLDDPASVLNDSAGVFGLSDGMKSASDAVKTLYLNGRPDRAFLQSMRDQIAVYQEAVKATNPNQLHLELGKSLVIMIPEEIVSGLKTLMYTSGSYGWAPHVPRIDKIVDFAVRRVTFDQLIPSYPASAPSFTYLEETLFEDNAAPVAETAAKPYSQFHLADVTVTVQVIAHLMAMTEQQVADIPQFMAFMQQRGLLMLDLKTEDQLISGTGTPPALQGFTTKSGTNAQTRGGDTIPDAIYKGFTKIRTIGFAEPSNVVMNPSDWEGIRLMKTSEGLYIWGHPSEAGPERLWGKPVLQTTAIAALAALAGDFPLYSGLYSIGGVQVAITNSNNDDFEKNRLTSRIEHRKGLAIFRASAFTVYDLT